MRGRPACLIPGLSHKFPHLSAGTNRVPGEQMAGPGPAHLGAPALDQPVAHSKRSVDHRWVTATMEMMREPSHHDMVMTFQGRKPANLFSQQAVC